MTIVIDCRMIDASGVGVYLRGCLSCIIKLGHELLLLGKAGKLQAFTSNSNVKIIDCNIKSFSIRELFFFPGKIVNQINKANIYYSPFFNIPSGITIPVFTTIHDIIFPDMPELTSRLGLEARMFFYQRCFRLSKKIFTVSEFSKSRIEYYSKGKKPVLVTYSAIQSQFLDFRAKEKKVPKKDTILFIGNIKKHKGLDYLLEAFLLAKKEGLSHQLVIIGDRENFRSADSHILRKIDSLNNETILFTGFVSDEQLMEYVSSATLLVQPSLYEGFCLPPLEALVLGTHALISDIPVLKEIYSGFPLTFFNAGNVIDLKDKMLELLSRKLPPPFLPDNLLSKYTFEKTTALIMGEFAI